MNKRIQNEQIAMQRTAKRRNCTVELVSMSISLYQQDTVKIYLEELEKLG